MVFSEIRRTPAMNGITDVLCRADDDSEDDEEDDRVLVVEPIDDVIVVTVGLGYL